jgi:hypothetical protein
MEINSKYPQVIAFVVKTLTVRRFLNCLQNNRQKTLISMIKSLSLDRLPWCQRGTNKQKRFLQITPEPSG